MDRGSRSAHVCRGEAHEFAEGYVPTPITRVATLAVADGELDGAGMLTLVDQPLPAGGDGALGGQDGSCQDAGQKKDGEPQKHSGSGFRRLDGRGAPKVANPPESVGKRRRAEASNRDVEQMRLYRRQPRPSNALPAREFSPPRRTVSMMVFVRP